MIFPFTRTTLLVVNGGEGDTEIEIREYRYGSLSGRYSEGPIRINGGRPKKVSATKFSSRNASSGRPSTLKVFLNGIDTEHILQPSVFVDFVKIVFNVSGEVGVDGRPQAQITTIVGVKARLFDLPRFHGFAFRGGDFEGRPLEPIH